MQFDATAGGLGRARTAPLTAEELAAAYLPRVHRFAVMVAPGADAEDLAQQAMIRAIERLPGFDPRRGSLDAWLWRIVVNLGRDAGRVARRHELLAERLRSRQRASAAPSPEALALDGLRDAELLAAVHRLAPRQRSLIALRYGAGLSAADIAVALGTSRMTVAKALRRALDRLRTDLAASEIQP